jgi:histidine phosphotransferase ChpT
MNNDDAAMLAELLCARLCHDLAGAVGAVGTGVELLAESGADPGPADEAMALLVESAAVAVHRLKFLRMALGGRGPAMASDQIRSLVGEFFGSQMGNRGALQLDWQDGGPPLWDADEAKLLLNLILMARDCLPRGGTVAVERRTTGIAAVGLRVAAQGVRAAAAEAVKALQATDVATLGPRGAQGYYTMLLARRMGLSINYEDSHDRLVFVTIKN